MRGRRGEFVDARGDWPSLSVDVVNRKTHTRPGLCGFIFLHIVARTMARTPKKRDDDSSEHSEMMTARSGRVRIVEEVPLKPPVGETRMLRPTHCSHCQSNLSGTYYECLTCQPPLYVLCERCERKLDVYEDFLFGDGPVEAFHDASHVWKKYR